MSSRCHIKGSLIRHLNSQLALHTMAATNKLSSQCCRIDSFQETRSEGIVGLEEGTENRVDACLLARPLLLAGHTPTLPLMPLIVVTIVFTP